MARLGLDYGGAARGATAVALAAHVPEPALAGWRTTALALGCALVIGGVGGLIGLGGGEFRLPILVGLIGFAARAAVPMNQILSACLISKVSDQRLERSIAVLLMAIGLLLVGERLLPSGVGALVPAVSLWQILAGITLGLCIGTISTFLGVAGGELLIPTLVFVFGADIRTAGSATLFVSIPMVCMGLWRYGRLGLLPSRRTLLWIGVPMGAESLVGAAAGGTFAGTTPADVLKLLLGIILVAAALKAFWRRSTEPSAG